MDDPAAIGKKIQKIGASHCPPLGKLCKIFPPFSAPDLCVKIKSDVSINPHPWSSLIMATAVSAESTVALYTRFNKRFCERGP